MKLYFKQNSQNMILLVSILTCFSISAYSQTKGANQVLVDDGAWCWFADPRAVYHKGAEEKIYYGYITSKGDVGVGSTDKNKNSESFILHEELQVDDHNVPSFLFLPDGKILTFYTEHNGRFFTRKSTNPEDIRAWEEEQTHSFGLEGFYITYSHPVMLSEENNRIYVFFRARNKRDPKNPKMVDWRQYYTYSDDLGETWVPAKSYLSSYGDHDKIPYLKVVSDHKSRIHFLFTDSHPKIGFASVYHMYYENGAFHRTDGEFVQEMDGQLVDLEKLSKLYDAKEGKLKAWIWDVALNKKGNPVVAYAHYPSVNDHIYRYAYWDGKKWNDKEVVNSGGYITSPEKNGAVLEEHYSGGIVLDHHNPDNIFLSRAVEGVFEIEKWNLKGNRWISQKITSGSTENNVRPYVVDHYPGKKPMVIWMQGRYEHFIRYNTRLLTNEVTF